MSPRYAAKLTFIPQKQRGVALIVVLLIVAMIVILASNITGRNQLMVRRTINQAEYDQAYWYALSAEELAKKILAQDFEDDPDSVNLQQYWAMSNIVFPVEQGDIAGEIQDLRSCFNLNALSVSNEEDKSTGQAEPTLAMRQFGGLLVALGMDDTTAEQITESVKDYIDEDSDPSAYGGEDAAYEARPVPYRAANTLFFDKSELRAVLGVSQNIYLRLAPYVCVIPADTTQVVNVNTLKLEQAPLLAGMFENKISVGEAEGIINQRPSGGYEEIDDFWDNSSIQSLKNDDDELSSSFVLVSDHFLLWAQARVDRAIFRLKSVLMRGSDNKIAVISRQFGERKIAPPVTDETSLFSDDDTQRSGDNKTNSENKK